MHLPTLSVVAVVAGIASASPLRPRIAPTIQLPYHRTLPTSSSTSSSFSQTQTQSKALSTESSPSTWPVVDFSCPGGSPAGCVYNLNISNVAPASNDTSFQFTEPEFNTFCNGTNIQGELKPCEDESVWTNMVDGFMNSTLIVRHKWTEPLTDGTLATVWIVGNYTWSYADGDYKAPTAFEVEKKEIYAVA